MGRATIVGIAVVGPSPVPVIGRMITSVAVGVDVALGIAVAVGFGRFVACGGSMICIVGVTCALGVGVDVATAFIVGVGVCTDLLLAVVGVFSTGGRSRSPSPGRKDTKSFTPWGMPGQ